VIAVAWRSSYEDAAAAASVLFPSGAVRWACDGDESVFSAFEIPYQPVTVLVAQGVEVERWLGARDAAGIRQALENLSQFG
jgi:hypothetical protein